MIQLNTHKDTYAIPVPLDAKDYDFVNSRTKHLTFTSRGVNLTIAMDVPTLNKYEILGEVTKGNISIYFDTGKHFYKSIYSLLAANGVYFVNPYGEDFEAKILGNYAEWQSYEDKLVEKVFIIKKIEII